MRWEILHSSFFILIIIYYLSEEEKQKSRFFALASNLSATQISIIVIAFLLLCESRDLGIASLIVFFSRFHVKL